MNFLIRLLITAIVSYLLAQLLPGIKFDGFGAAVIFAIVLAVLNLIFKPILSLLGLPLTLITLGLFSLVINAIVVLVADYFVDSMHINGFLWALVFSLLLSFLTSLLSSTFAGRD